MSLITANPGVIKGLRGGLEQSAVYVLAALVILDASNDLSGIVIDEALSIESKHKECLLRAKLFAN